MKHLKLYGESSSWYDNNIDNEYYTNMPGEGIAAEIQLPIFTSREIFTSQEISMLKKLTESPIRKNYEVWYRDKNVIKISCIGYNNVLCNIYKTKDEWYYIESYIHFTEVFKCDQFDGLVKALEKEIFD